MLFSEEPPPCSSQDISTSAEETIIATCQKLLYDFHERHHSDKPVINIYSLAWQNRLTAWYSLYAHAPSCLLIARQQCQVVARTKHSHLNNNNSTTTTITSLPFQQQQQLRAEDFDLRILFFTYPIQAFALWGVLQAFYALDAAVCGWAPSSSSSSSYFRGEKLVSRINDADGVGVGTSHDWQALRPLKYLTSADVKRAWRVALEKLNADIRSERLRGCELERRICRIYVGVEGVEERVTELVGDCAKVGRVGFGYVLEVVQRVMDERCLMIDEILGAEEANAMTDEVQEDEKSVCVMLTA